MTTTTQQPDPHQLPCPIPNCWGQIKIAHDTPAGTYQCICHYAQLRLDWDTYQQPPRRRPRLATTEQP